MQRAAFRNEFGPPPASMVTRVTRRARWVALVASACHALRVQLRRPATLLPYRGVLRVGARNHAGSLGSGGRTFSFGASLASPNDRVSFLLRDNRHSKSQIGNDSTPPPRCRQHRRRRARDGLLGASRSENSPFRDGSTRSGYGDESGRCSHLTVTANSQEKRGFPGRQRLAPRYFAVCIVSLTRLRPGVHQPDPPGLIHDDPRLLPPWRGSSFLWDIHRFLTRPGLSRPGCDAVARSDPQTQHHPHRCRVGLAALRPERQRRSGEFESSGGVDSARRSRAS